MQPVSRRSLKLESALPWHGNRRSALLILAVSWALARWFDAALGASMSLTARMEGFLKLERFIDTDPDPFIVKGLRLVVDGVAQDTMQEILEIDISSYERDQRHAIKVWEAAGGYAPTIGILGAVLGLIRVMENLADPTLLGSGIAVAFVATIYGVGLANLICLPIANKIKQHVQHEVLKREMLAQAFVSIGRGENLLLIRERLSSHWQQET